MKKKERRPSIRLAAVLGCGLLTLGAACGVKTPPYPAREVLPAAPAQLGQTLTEDGYLILSVRPPEKNMAGRPLKALGGFRVEMAEDALTPHYCEGCPRRFREVARIPAGPAPPGLNVPPGPFEFRRRLERGRLYTFRVYSVSPRDQNHPEALKQTLVWSLDPPPPVAGFSGRLEDRAVRLAWQAPVYRDGQGHIRHLQEDTAPARVLVEVERRLGPDAAWRILPQPSQDDYYLALTDYNVAYGDEPGYRARWLLKMGETRIPGPYSPEYRVKVIDFTPPAPPARLYAAAGARGVRLNWDDSPDPDLAGYRVYRRLEGQENFSPVGPALIPENAFLDLEASPEKTVYYQVTAIDNSPRANESAPSPPVMVRPVAPLAPVPPRPAPPAADEF